MSAPSAAGAYSLILSNLIFLAPAAELWLEDSEHYTIEILSLILLTLGSAFHHAAQYPTIQFGLPNGCTMAQDDTYLLFAITSVPAAFMQHWRPHIYGHNHPRYATNRARARVLFTVSMWTLIVCIVNSQLSFYALLGTVAGLSFVVWCMVIATDPAIILGDKEHDRPSQVKWAALATLFTVAGVIFYFLSEQYVDGDVLYDALHSCSHICWGCAFFFGFHILMPLKPFTLVDVELDDIRIRVETVKKKPKPRATVKPFS